MIRLNETVVWKSLLSAVRAVFNTAENNPKSVSRRWWEVSVVILLFAATFGVSPAYAVETPLPAGAQQAFDKGVIAAEQEAWELAITYFGEALGSAPRDPRILYYLGLSHERAGHQLIAIAWFRAYLAATPQAPNAAVVDKEVVLLKDQVKSNIKRIFEAALEASQVSGAEKSEKHFESIMVFQAAAGDLDGAQQTLREIVDLWPIQELESNMWNGYIRYLTDIGEVGTAQNILNRVQDRQVKISSECLIAKGLTSIGDFAGARQRLVETEKELRELEALYRVEDEKGKYDSASHLRDQQIDLMLEVADAYAVNGQAKAYERVLKEADEIAKKYQYQISSETPSKISAALQSNRKDKNRHISPAPIEPVEEWTYAAGRFSTPGIATDLKASLLWAKSPKLSDEICMRLLAVGSELSNRLNAVVALEKKCALAANKPPMLSVQPKLQFRLFLLDDPTADSEEMVYMDPSTSYKTTIYVERTPSIDGQAVKSASVVTDKRTGEVCITITFTKEGEERFNLLVLDNMNEILALIIDGQVDLMSVINKDMPKGVYSVCGFRRQEAKNLVGKINRALTKNKLETPRTRNKPKEAS